MSLRAKKSAGKSLRAKRIVGSASMVKNNNVGATARKPEHDTSNGGAEAQPKPARLVVPDKAPVKKQPKAVYTPPRPFKIGDLVTISTDPTLAQIVAIDGEGAIIAPLIDTDTDEAANTRRRFGWEVSELRLVPTPPLRVPSDAKTHILAEIHCSAEVFAGQHHYAAESASPEQRAEQLRRLNAAADAFKLFHSIWVGLAEGLNTGIPSIFAGSGPEGKQGNDAVPLEQLYVLANRTNEALDDVLVSMRNQYAFERCDEIEALKNAVAPNDDRDLPFGVPMTQLHTELAKDHRGELITLGDMVRPTESHGGDGGGPVVAIAGDHVTFCYDANYPPQYQCYTAHDLEVITDLRGLKALLAEDKDRETSDVTEVVPSADVAFTNIVTTDTKDVRGHSIKPGDFVTGTEEVISSGYASGGRVVAVAGNAMLIEITGESGSTFYDAGETNRYIVQSANPASGA